MDTLINIIIKRGLAKSIKDARQTIKDGKVKVRDKVINDHALLLRKNEIIFVKR